MYFMFIRVVQHIGDGGVFGGFERVRCGALVLGLGAGKATDPHRYEDNAAARDSKEPSECPSKNTST